MTEKRILIGVCIFLSLVFAASLVFLIFMHTGEDGRGSYANIYQDGILIKTVSLEKEETFLVEGENGGYNKIQVKDGSIGVIEASCPDFLCGKMGFISHGPIPITCLPNKLVVEIERAKEDGAAEEVDGVTY
ncbi:MAG: NusG domain II-containing protein [Lachnospiraceae bacterium]|nr:NusG domain II-containing protein [Lachnospiraceae bacterium]